MYFKQKNYFLLNKKEKIDVSTFEKLDQLKVFHRLFDGFIKYHHKKIIKENNAKPFKPKTKDFYNLKLSLRFENQFRNFLNIILDEMIKNNYSEKYYFERVKSKFKRSTWYSFKKKIIKLTNRFVNDGYFEWTNHLGKLPIKNHVERKYDSKDIKFIIDQ